MFRAQTIWKYLAWINPSEYYLSRS